MTPMMNLFLRFLLAVALVTVMLSLADYAVAAASVPGAGSGNGACTPAALTCRSTTAAPTGSSSVCGIPKA